MEEDKMEIDDPQNQTPKKDDPKQPKTETNHRKKISFQYLRQLFEYTAAEAANKIGVSSTQLKRVCRELNIPRWPFRRIRSLQHEIKVLERQLANTSDKVADNLENLTNRIVNLRKTKEYICNHPKVITEKSNTQILDWFEKQSRVGIPSLVNPAGSSPPKQNALISTMQK